MLHEIFIIQHDVHGRLQVLLGISDICIVSVIGQIGDVEHVLGCVVTLSRVVGEYCLSADNVLAAGGIVLDVDEGHEWIVFPISC